MAPRVLNRFPKFVSGSLRRRFPVHLMLSLAIPIFHTYPVNLLGEDSI